MHRRIATGALLVVIVAGCSATGPESSASGGPTGPSGASLRPSESLDLATAPPSTPPITGEVPLELVEAVRADLAGRTGVDAAGATLIVGEAVEWPDGSLGCPLPDVMYTQAIVPGYRVVLGLDGRQYDYRLSDRGEIRLCEGVGPIGS